ncbi:MAG TPA: hypothetical protein VG247_02900 [Pseudonocardiaceae bacterium]|nr:hypothetical protein [Pseudonocardiaceae bacterium]
MTDLNKLDDHAWRQPGERVVVAITGVPRAVGGTGSGMLSAIDNPFGTDQLDAGSRLYRMPPSTASVRPVT